MVIPIISTHWRLIKAYVSWHIAKSERITQSREKRGERGLYLQDTSGSNDFGNTLFATKGIIGNLSTTFIGIL